MSDRREPGLRPSRVIAGWPGSVEGQKTNERAVFETPAGKDGSVIFLIKLSDLAKGSLAPKKRCKLRSSMYASGNPRYIRGPVEQ